jgi:BASS family bile acid:Na+ symporter
MEGSSLLMPIAIGIIMFGIGITLQFKDFVRVLVHPKAILTGLGCQLILLPALALLLATVWPLESVYQMGLVLVAACPGGTASNLVTHMLQGRVALSVSLTSFNSFLIPFTIPLIVNIASGLYLKESKEISLEFWNTISELLYTVLAPVVVGVLFNQYFPKLAAKAKKPLKFLLPGILFAVFAYVLFFGDSEGSPDSAQQYMHLVWPALAMNLVTIIIGFLMAGLMNIDKKGRFTIGIEMGLQNSALAIFIATDLLDNQKMAMMAIIYASFTFFTTLGTAWLLKKYA